MENPPSSSTSEELKRGQEVELTAFGYKTRRGYLTRQAIPARDGTIRWYVAFKGSFTEIPFRIDEFKTL